MFFPKSFKETELKMDKNDKFEINRVRLLVDGEFLEGWEAALIEIGMEQLCRAFVLSVTNELPGKQEFLKLHPGQKVELFIGPDKVCTGFITSIPAKYNAKNVNIQIQGKSRTVDLVNCCSPWAEIAPSIEKGESGGWNKVNEKVAGKEVAPSKTVNTSWRNESVDRIIANLCAPYGIKVYCQPNIGTKLINFTVNPGETVFDSIGRLLRKDNLVISDDEYGNLVILEAGSGGKCTDSLEEGKNILSGSAKFDVSQVYSKYVVLGQHKGSDLEFGRSVCQDKGIADDSRIGRYRLLVIKDTGQSSNTIAENRADFEKNYRGASTFRSIHSVQGWRQSDGTLWGINKKVLVRDSILELDHEFLISKVVFSLNKEGLKTEIETIDINAYSRKVAQNKKATESKESPT